MMYPGPYPLSPARAALRPDVLGDLPHPTVASCTDPNSDQDTHRLTVRCCNDLDVPTVLLMSARGEGPVGSHPIAGQEDESSSIFPRGHLDTPRFPSGFLLCR